MARLAFAFLSVGVTAAVLGFGGFAGEVATPVKALAFIFFTLAAVAGVTSRAVPSPSTERSTGRHPPID